MYDTVVLDGSANLLLKGSAEVGIFTALSERYPVYTGDTVITPTQETQVLHTEMKSTLTDITINPIPSNYGLITWDGATLTVS